MIIVRIFSIFGSKVEFCTTLTCNFFLTGSFKVLKFCRVAELITEFCLFLQIKSSTMEQSDKCIFKSKFKRPYQRFNMF